MPTQSRIYHALDRIALGLFPSAADLNERDRNAFVGDVFGLLYNLPLVLGGLLWLIAATDLSGLVQQLPALAITLALMLALFRFDFVALIELSPGAISDISGTLESVLTVAVVLMFGTNGLWVAFLAELGFHWRRYRDALPLNRRLNAWRNLAVNLGHILPGGLSVLALYRALGGAIPLPGLSLTAIGMGLGFWAAWTLAGVLVWLPMLLYIGLSLDWMRAGENAWPLLRFFLIALVVFDMGGAFGPLAAGLYAAFGLPAFLFFSVALLLVGFLANRFSRVLVRVRRQTTLLEGLEQLGRELIGAPPQVEAISDILNEYLTTAPLLMPRRAEVRLRDGTLLAHSPVDWQPDLEAAWAWMWEHQSLLVAPPRQELPWGGSLYEESLVFAPIERESDEDGASPHFLGGLYMQARLGPFFGRDQRDMLNVLQPAMRTLAAQVAGALQHIDDYRAALERQRMERELELAGRIQSTFLPDPDSIPKIPGWQLAVSLESARETSGDFFDLIELPGGKLGFVVADVADKGVGAALYMALSRTYLRAAALSGMECGPGQTLTTVNRRILEDTHSDQFVTVFYAVLDPTSGELAYANAGHPPALWLPAAANRPVQPLTRTGMALGVMEDEAVGEGSIQMAPGDRLVFYSDGISEAENPQGEQFGIDGLVEQLAGMRGMETKDVQQAIIERVREFTQGAAQMDDITLLVVGRE